MLKLTIPLSEGFDEATGKFVTTKSVDLELEHSLVALSKWESEYEKPFLSKTPKTSEETLAYIRMMVLTPDVSPEVFGRLTQANVAAIDTYINRKMTATTFSRIDQQRSSREIITAEVIYYWMSALNVDMECQYWHLNQLLTYIQVINRKNTPQKKMSKRQLLQRNNELNAQRRAAMGTSG